MKPDNKKGRSVCRLQLEASFITDNTRQHISKLMRKKISYFLKSNIFAEE
jgi:hypothetical protein